MSLIFDKKSILPQSQIWLISDDYIDYLVLVYHYKFKYYCVRNHDETKYELYEIPEGVLIIKKYI